MGAIVCVSSAAVALVWSLVYVVCNADLSRKHVNPVML